MADRTDLAGYYASTSAFGPPLIVSYLIFFIFFHYLTKPRPFTIKNKETWLKNLQIALISFHLPVILFYFLLAINQASKISKTFVAVVMGSRWREQFLLSCSLNFFMC